MKPRSQRIGDDRPQGSVLESVKAALTQWVPTEGVVIPNEGHNMFTQPGPAARAIASFLSRHPMATFPADVDAGETRPTTSAIMGEMSREHGPWVSEGIDLIRAMSGGLLFGIPLLFTMEVWWVGTATEPGRMIAVLALALLVVVVLNRTSGFRSTKDVRLVDALFDGLEAVAVGIVSVFVLLFVLQEITLQTPIREAIGKVVYESVPFVIGIGLAHHFLRHGRSAGDDDGSASRSKPDDSTKATVADVGATVIGAVFIAFNIAPTDEVPMLAARMSPVPLFGFVAVSLVVSFSIVFVAGFANEEQRHSQQGILQHPITETLACYLVALLSAATMLWFFQRLDLSAPWGATLTNVIVLGLPASVGGAAGRLAV